MSASANIFEVLAEIDAKFSKILDKEYDAISGEVRKWFKKLAVGTCSASDHSVNDFRACRRRKGLTTSELMVQMPESNMLVYLNAYLLINSLV
jgi:hypothetical protein